MVIPNENFKNDLRSKFIELLDSGRGVQTKLAKAINKPASYFSEIKRGNPVNALHLKAVGIVFGSDKVVELLGIDNKPTNNVTRVVIEHQNIIEQFQDPEKAKEFNEFLVGVEKHNPKGYDNLYGLAKSLYESTPEGEIKSKKTRKSREDDLQDRKSS